MGLDVTDVVDAAGIDRATGNVVLSILDSWTWDDERPHLEALREKLNAYVQFIEAGELASIYPGVNASCVFIDVVWRFAPPEAALELLSVAQAAFAKLGVSIRSRLVESV